MNYVLCKITLHIFAEQLILQFQIMSRYLIRLHCGHGYEMPVGCLLA